MCSRRFPLRAALTVIIAVWPCGVRAQELEVPLPTEEQPAENPPTPAEEAYPAPADLEDALDRATEAIREAERGGADMQAKLKEAEHYVVAALGLDPANLRAEFINGRMNMLIGRARDAFSQVSSYASSPEGAKDWEAFKIWGDLLLQGTYYVQAEAKYKQARELNPNEASIYIGLAECASNRGRRLDAITYAQRAQQLDPSSADGYDAYAGALQAQGMLEEAREAVRAAIGLTQTALRDQPADTALLFKLYARYGSLQSILQTLVQEGRRAGADPSLYTEHVLEYVETVLAKTEIGRLLAVHQVWIALEGTIASGESSPPPELVYKLAELSLVIRQYDRAVELLEEVLAADATDAKARALLEELRAAAAGPPATAAGPPATAAGPPPASTRP